MSNGIIGRRGMALYLRFGVEAMAWFGVGGGFGFMGVNGMVGRLIIRRLREQRGELCNVSIECYLCQVADTQELEVCPGQATTCLVLVVKVRFVTGIIMIWVIIWLRMDDRLPGYVASDFFTAASTSLASVFHKLDAFGSHPSSLALEDDARLFEPQR